MNRFFEIFFLCLLFIFFGVEKKKEILLKKEKKIIIYMDHADSTFFSKKINPNIHIIKGNVLFHHGNTHLHCDSAYFYAKNNLLEAFSNICINQGDTLHIYGDYLIYEGTTGLVKINGNVRINNRNITLLTNNFNYDKNINLGYFFDGGTLVDSLNELTSTYGQYSLDTKNANFRGNVMLKSSQLELKSDALKYNTINKIATISGNSNIKYDNVVIHSTNCMYDLKNERSIFFNRSMMLIKNKEKTLTADTLFYNYKMGIGKAFGHIVFSDTIKKEILVGNYGYYDKPKNFIFVTDSAKFIKFLQKDSLFLHADTLQMQIFDKKQEILKAFHNVQIYKKDLQVVCDSLQFNTKSSTLFLCKNPILWSKNYQLSGELIKIFFNDTIIDRINVIDNVFIIEKKKSGHFNQIKGENLTAFFINGSPIQINIKGNTESIYFFNIKNGIDFSGYSKTKSQYMTIYIKDYNPVKILFYPEPKAEIFSTSYSNSEQKLLEKAVYYDFLRPKNKNDIFDHKVMKNICKS
ncbi:MAG: hypothetical protein LBC54_03050 [Bacteroidales bacterium OttesenSCG-928-I14]|nr:hypothetical protein [Bacteroidales bacterium OttesenSCG-928-I14]